MSGWPLRQIQHLYRSEACLREHRAGPRQIAQELGFTKLGVMAIDATSLRANASRKATKSFGELQRHAEDVCADALNQAEAADTAIQQPERLPRPTKTKIEAALEKAKLAHAADTVHRAELKKQIKASGVETPPLPSPQEVSEAKLVNLTDADCHTMRMKEGYSAPGCNAQLGVDTKTLLINAATISDSSVDSHQLLAVAQESQKNCRGAVHTVVADSGYDNNHQIHELETRHGMHALVAVQDPHRLSTKHKQRWQRQRTRALKLKRIEELETPRGRELLAAHSCSVEPVIGTIKHAMGFRMFLQRGETAYGEQMDFGECRLQSKAAVAPPDASLTSSRHFIFRSQAHRQRRNTKSKAAAAFIALGTPQASVCPRAKIKFKSDRLECLRHL